jgi:peptidyl-prolyl cis-trans isomerase SurA
VADGRRVRLRALLCEGEDEARRIHEQLKKRRITFTEAVLAHGNGAGQGVPLELSWSNLSEAHREALEGLRPGQVSRPVELNGDVYLFKLESWMEDPSQVERQLAEQTRQGLEGVRRRQAYLDLLRELRARTRISLKLRKLPFEYIPEERG